MTTADKRRSAISLSLPWRGMLPSPDGGFTSYSDRRQLAYHYAGDFQTVWKSQSATGSPAGNIGITGRPPNP